MHADTNDRPLYFECSICGECCSSWNIPIEGEKARALLTREWVTQRLSETRRELVKVTDALYRLPLTDENVCVFLGEDRRCMVEAHEGLALKPKECQRFPFAAIEMPNGTLVHDTSASCKRIAEKLLLAFQPILPVPDSREDTTPSDSEASDEEPERIPKRLYAGVFRRVPVETYEIYLQRLRVVFSDSGNTPEMALRQARLLLKGLPSSLERQEDNLLGRVNLYQPSWIEQLILLFFLRKPYGIWSWFNLLQGRMYHDPRVFGMPVDLRAVKQVAWNPACNQRLNAFLYNLLCRRMLLARGGSLSSILALATVAQLLVRWYARTLAWIRETKQVETADVSMAIRLVERYYTGHQPRFLQFFTARLRSRLVVALLYL